MWLIHLSCTPMRRPTEAEANPCYRSRPALDSLNCTIQFRTLFTVKGHVYPHMRRRYGKAKLFVLQKSQMKFTDIHGMERRNNRRSQLPAPRERTIGIRQELWPLLHLYQLIELTTMQCSSREAQLTSLSPVEWSLVVKNCCEPALECTLQEEVITSRKPSTGLKVCSWWRDVFSEPVTAFFPSLLPAFSWSNNFASTCLSTDK